MSRKPSGTRKKYDRFVVIPDTQWPFENRRAEAALQEFVADVTPEILIHIGDAADFYSLADFRKKMPPSSRLYFKKEVLYARQKLKDWAACSPGSRRFFIEGNHEARLARYLETRAPELYDLCDDLSVPRMLHCGESGWEYRGPYGAGLWVGKKGGLYATHGQYCAEGAIPKMLKMLKCSFIQGHTHRLRMIAESTSLLNQTIGGYEIGTLCDPEKTPKNAPHVNWQTGFAHGWVSRTTKQFSVNLVSINHNRFIAEGKEYGGR